MLQFAKPIVFYCCVFTCVVFAVFSLVGPVSMVNAQFGEDEEGFGEQFVPAPREITRALNRGQALSEEGKYSEAIRVLAPIIDGQEDEDFFVPAQGTNTYTSVLQEVTRVIGEMPRRGREVYELQFGIRAGKLLELAVEQNDIDQIRGIAAKFFHTKAGFEATMLLGRYHLDKGEPLPAAFSFQRIVDTPQARELYKPQVHLLLASAWNFAGQTEKSVAVLHDLSQQYPDEEIVIGGEAVDLFANNSNAAKWLSETIGSPVSRGSQVQKEWLTHRGNHQRNGKSIGGLPLIQPDWKVPISNDDATAKVANELLEEYRGGQAMPAIPAVNALAVADCIVMRTPEKLVGIDFRTGKRIWIFPWEDEDPIGAEKRSDSSNSEQRLQESLPDRVRERLFYDSAFGQMSSDGKNVYFLDEVGYSASSRPFGGRFSSMRDARDTNRLVAVQVSDESGNMVHSKLQWWIGDESGMDEPELAGAFFLGAPLAINDELYVICEIKRELRLVALDRNHGRLKWSQQLVAVESSGKISEDGVRRLAGASPSFSDGVLVCPTSTGAVVAIDALTRRLMWGFRYKRLNEEITRRGIFHNGEQRSPAEKWLDSTATIVDTNVIITPVDGDEMHCLNLFDGSKVWKKSVRRDKAICIAGTWNDHLIMIGDNLVRAIRLQDGSQAWETPIAEHGQISGRGYINGDRLCLPTSKSQLLEIELSAGRIDSVIETAQPLGNLIVYKDKVISHGADWVLACPQDVTAREFVKQQFASNTPNRRAILLKSQLLINDSQFTEALDILLTQYREQPRSREQQLLVRAMAGSLETDFANAVDRIAEFEKLVGDSASAPAYLRLKLAGYIRRNEPEKAIATLFDLADAPTPATTEYIDSDPNTTSIRLDRWLQLQVETLTQHASDEQVASAKSAIQKQVAKIASDGSTERLRHIANYLGAIDLAVEANIELARRELQEGNLLSAEMLFDSLQDSPNETIAATAFAGLARTFEAAGEPENAIAHFELLAMKYPKVKCWNGQTGSELLSDAISDGRLEKTNPVSWNYGRVVVSQSDDFGGGGDRLAARKQLQLTAQRGVSPRNLVLNYDSESSVYIRNESGQTIYKFAMVERDEGDYRRFAGGYYGAPTYKMNGHLLVVVAGYHIVGVDLFRVAQTENNEKVDPVLWRIDNTPSSLKSDRSIVYRGQPSPRLNAWGAPIVVDRGLESNLIGIASWPDINGFCFVKGKELHCIDPLTGELLWSRRKSLGIQRNSECFSDEQFVYSMTPSGKVRQFSLFNGRQIDTFTVPKSTDQWKKSGNRFLAWNTDGKTSTMFVYDLRDRKPIWEFELPSDSLANLVKDDRLAILAPDYQLKILDLHSGEKLIDTTLPQVEEWMKVAELRREELMRKLKASASMRKRTRSLESTRRDASLLQSILLLEDEGRYYVGLNKLSLKQNQSVELIRTGTQIKANVAGQLFNGLIVSIDKASGKSVWPCPVQIENMAFPAQQPANAPLLAFVRELQSSGANRRQARPHVEMTVIDKRDGRPVFRTSKLSTGLYSFRVTSRTKGQSVRIDLANESHLLEITNDPVAPAVPAQIGAVAASDDPSEKMAK